MSDWVLQNDNIDSVVGNPLSDDQRLEIQSIAKKSSSNGICHDVWEKLAVEFVNKGLGDESNLYREKGAFSHIIKDADESEFANTCGGSMAVFKFSK